MLCCLSQRKQHFTKSISGDSSSHEFDIFNDEGSDIQQTLWQNAYKAKIDASSESAHLKNLLGGGKTVLSADDCLKTVTTQYQTHGFAKKATDIKRLLDAVQPLTAAVTALTQSDQIASLTWGSLLFVFQCTLKFVTVFDTIKSMLTELTRLLPRFQAFVEVLPTPRLHSALRDLYETYATFCISTASVLDANSIYLCLKIQWSGIDIAFKTAQQEIKTLSKEFESEVLLASTQKDKTRHLEILSLLSNTMEGPSTTGLPARNPLFIGREAVLRDLKARLLPDDVELEKKAPPRQTCMIRGMGGMGKTQVALEYTYRYRQCYDYIFWLQSESDAILTENFLNLARKVGIDTTNLTTAKQVDLAREFLESTASRWLLVFDNVESASVLLPFWPAGVHGNILVTTQHSDLALPATTTIDLQIMEPEEGSELIRQILKRGDSEKDVAEKLSRELGGHPLAIAHFAGYVSKSQCVLDDILSFLQKSKRSKMIWSSENVATSSNYTRTMETIWELAVTRLTPDAKELLDVISFLSPECMQQEIFITEENQEQVQGWSNWSNVRFNEAVAILRERYLVDRTAQTGTSFLTTHRTLQALTLQKLDESPDLRQRCFEVAQRLIRRVFPRQSILKRGDTSSWPQSLAFLPHVLSLHVAFVRSDPAIHCKLDFAALLGDAGRFLFEWFWNPDAVPLLLTAKDICKNNQEAYPLETEALLPSLLCHLGLFEQCDGIPGRQRARQNMIEAVAMQEQYITHLSPQKPLDADVVNLGRFYNDLGVTYLEDDQVGPAEPLFKRALETYETIGGQSAQAVRYGHTYSHQALAQLAGGKLNEAQSLAQEGCEIIEGVLGPESNGYLFYTFSRAVILFNTGRLEEAAALHQDVLGALRKVLGYNHHHTLASLYHVALCEQARGDLEAAEQNLREVLRHDVYTYQWREEDVARTAFRLSIVLHEQNRVREAAQFEEQARSLQSKWASSIPDYVGRHSSPIHKELARYDYAVWIWHGRTSGVWSPGPGPDSKAML